MQPMTPTPTALEIIRKAYSMNPDRRYAVNPEANMIAAYDRDFRRFVGVAAWTITGVWVAMDYELLIDGKPLVNDWLEIPRGAEA